LPVLVNAVEATNVALNGTADGGLELPLTIMSVFTIIFVTISYVLFEYVLED